MADAALKHMTVEEFLAWDDGTDRRYELVAGEIVAMAPPQFGHGTFVIHVGGEIRSRLRPPCRIGSEAGIRLAHRDDMFFQADLAATCIPRQPKESWVPDPVLIVEVLSPSTEEHDRKVKLPEYRELGSVREIVLIDPSRVYCEIHRWQEDGRWLVDLILDQSRSLRLDSVGVEVPLSAVYAEISSPAA